MVTIQSVGCALALLSFAAPCGAGEVDEAAERIRAGGLRAHMELLASDLFEGRGTATRGHALAAAYVQAWLSAQGAEPAGDGGSFRQTVPLLRASMVPGGCELVLTGPSGAQTLAYERDYLASEPLAAESGEVDALVVFAGFGVSAPALGHDDYAGLDVRGKIVATLRGAPSSFPATLRAFYSDRQQKLDAAISHGAAGVLSLWTSADEKYFPWKRAIVQRRNEAGVTTWLSPNGEPHAAFAELRARAVLSPAAGQRLFEGAPRSLDEVVAQAETGAPRGFALATRARLRVAAKHERLASDNVAALIPGSDPRLREEVVVLTAHLDHMGIGEPEDGDAIYNGAVDNAAGVATVLEAARAIAALPVKPRRSVLLLAVTGEELGMLGSTYFAEHPTLPRARIVANLNVDGNALPFAVDDVVLYGEGHSTLGPIARRAAERSGFSASPDPWPDQVVFIRSDQYAFVQRGIPSLYPDLGVHSPVAGVDGLAQREEWERSYYHSPQDEVDQPLDWATSERFARFFFRLAVAVADARERPRWNPGDFFGSRFGGVDSARPR